MLGLAGWISEATGENIILPTEAQWQYAAQSGDGRTTHGAITGIQGYAIMPIMVLRKPHP